METSWVLVALLACACIAFVLSGIYAGWKYKVLQLSKEVKLLIEEYKARCTGVNRFLFNEELMLEIYKRDYSRSVIHEVWRQLVVEKAIERDNMDNEWCIKK